VVVEHDDDMGSHRAYAFVAGSRGRLG